MGVVTPFFGTSYLISNDESMKILGQEYFDINDAILKKYDREKIPVSFLINEVIGPNLPSWIIYPLGKGLIKKFNSHLLKFEEY